MARRDTLLSPGPYQTAGKRSIDKDDTTEIDVEHVPKRRKHETDLVDDTEGVDSADIGSGVIIDPDILDASIPVLDNLEAEADSGAGMYEAHHNNTDDTATGREAWIDVDQELDNHLVPAYGPPVSYPAQFEQPALEQVQLYNAFPDHITSRFAAIQDAIHDEFRRWNANDHRQITPAMRQHTAKRFYTKLTGTTTPDKHSEKWLIYCAWSLEEKTYEICTIGSMLPVHSDKTVTATGRVRADHLTGRSLGYIDRVEAILLALDEVQVCKDVLDGIKDLEYAVVGAPLLAVRTKQAYKKNNGSRRASRNVDGGATPSKRGAPKKNIVKRKIKIEEPTTPKPPRFVMPRPPMMGMTAAPRGSFGRKIVRTMSPAVLSPSTLTPFGPRLPSYKGRATVQDTFTDEDNGLDFAFAGFENAEADPNFMRELEEVIRLEDQRIAQQYPYPGPENHGTSIGQDVGPVSPFSYPDNALDDWFDFAAADANEFQE